MYQEHPCFKEPDKKEVKIWRYLDFAKLVSLLDRKQLFFARLNKLKDSFEGSIPKANKVAAKEAFDDLSPNMQKKYIENVKAQTGITYNEMRETMFINCWHMNEHESAGMWQLYSENSKGIAIQSTFSNFSKAFNDTHAPIFIGKIQYIDYNTTTIPEDNYFFRQTHKRLSFEHEKELRAVFWGLAVGYEPAETEHCNDVGIYLNINLNSLVDAIYVSPESPNWFFDLVKSIISRYEYDFPVFRSSLSEGPFF